MNPPEPYRRLTHKGKTYYTKTERRWGMWNMIRVLARITPGRITPSMATPALTRTQARAAMRHLAMRGELVLVRKGWNNNRGIQEPIYKLSGGDKEKGTFCSVKRKP